ncbi:MAG: hypothetical protein ACLPH3_14515 [Terracidiphilus sp.]
MNDAELNMTAAPTMRELAHRLLAHEAVAGKTSELDEAATLRVYEKLRQSLGKFVGVTGFQSLAFRALTQAKSEAPGLWAVRLAADGTLQGLGEFGPQAGEFESQPGSSKDQTSEGGAALISRLLELLLIFLGEALTLSLLRNAWPDEVFDDRN